MAPSRALGVAHFLVQLVLCGGAGLRGFIHRRLHGPHNGTLKNGHCDAICEAETGSWDARLHCVTAHLITYCSRSFAKRETLKKLVFPRS